VHALKRLRRPSRDQLLLALERAHAFEYAEILRRDLDRALDDAHDDRVNADELLLRRIAKGKGHSNLQ
jgi:hypothetical protein